MKLRSRPGEPEMWEGWRINRYRIPCFTYLTPQAQPKESVSMDRGGGGRGEG